jgi:hypothetical protein
MLYGVLAASDDISDWNLKPAEAAVSVRFHFLLRYGERNLVARLQESLAKSGR